MKLKDFTVIDFETTGLNPVTDQIIQVALIRVRDGKPAMTFNSYVQLEHDQPWKDDITKWTGITEDQLKGGLTLFQVADALDHLLNCGEHGSEGREIMVGHNILFDLGFLELTLRKNSARILTLEAEYGTEWNLDNPFIDTLTIARDRMGYPHKLENVARNLKVELSQAHDALFDATATKNILLAFDAQKPVYNDYLNVAGYREKYGEPAWYPAHTKLKKQGASIYDVTPSEDKEKRQKNVLPKTTVFKTKNKRTPKIGG